MPNDITAAGTLSTKATKALDTMRARIVKADEARAVQAAEAAAAAVTANRDAAEAWHSRAAPVTRTPRPGGTVGRRCPRASAPPPGERAPTRARDAARRSLSRSMPWRPWPAGGAPARSPLSRARIPLRQRSVSGRGITPTTNRRHDMATHTPDQPVAEVRLGRITATIWRNRTVDDDGGFYSTQLTRLYRRDEQWERAHTFGRDDLLTVAKVADMANTRIHDLQAEARATGAADADPEGHPGHDQDA